MKLSSRTGAQPAAIDVAGKIETRGIEYIPEKDRHGKPAQLFPVWLSANVAYVYLLLGGSLIVLGLAPWQAFVVLAIGNLLWLVIGLLAISGPSSGTPSEVIMRAMLGVRGNRVFGAGLGWLTAVVYEGLNLAIGALAGFALIESLGIPVTALVEVLVAVVIGVVTFTISIYGHATIVRVSAVFTVVLGVCMLTLGGFVTTRATLHSVEPLHGGAFWAAALSGVVLVGAAPLSWGSSADYSRYLPTHTSKWRVAAWTAFGGWLPAMILGGIGILAGTVVDMSDPQTSFRAILPGWFYPIFLLILVLGSITNNVLTAYSAGLSLQAIGVRMSRARTVLIDAVIGGALCAYALLSASFLTGVSNLLALTVAYLAPATTVYAVDIVLRRNRYDGHQLHDERPGGPFWYRSGFNPAGVGAVVIGTAVGLLCVETTILTGPFAALTGTDLSIVAGPIVAGVLYVVIGKSRLMREGNR